MFDLRRIPIVRALLPLAGGSLAGYGILNPVRLPEIASPATQAWILSAMGLMWIIMLVTFRRTAGKAGRKQGLFSLFAFAIFFLSGALSFILSRPEDPGLPLDRKLMIRGEITEGPKPGKSMWSYGMNIQMVSWEDSTLAVKTHLKVYVKSPSMTVGETWLLYGHLLPITNSGNPGAPDYRLIMGRKNCWYRFFTDGKVSGRKVAGDQGISSARMRIAFSSYWEGADREISLLKAVCLGDQSDLSDDLKQAYSHAGAMHLLAVSGLHMGLIWWVLYHLFSWMVRISGKELPRSLTIILLLWIFAFVSGFSSSVSRSATMFTLFTAGRMMDQRIHSLNGILVSAFLLILIHPQGMYQVGFQLSYTAILGIVCLYPPLRTMLKIKNRILGRIWEASLVSFSAQLSTAPLVIYYFHQIPVYSLLSSLLTIPLLSILISIFVISVPFTMAGMLSTFFNALLVKMAFFMNELVALISSLPGAVMGELRLDIFSLCLWMSMLLVLMIMLNHRSVLPRYLMLALVSLTLCWTSVTRYRLLHSSEMVISHFNRASLLTFREGDMVDHYYCCPDSSTFSYMERYLSETWNRRQFKSRRIDLGRRIPEWGSISACQYVAPGVWILGNERTKIWIFSGAENLKRTALQRYPPELFESFGSAFVLLSSHPPPWLIPTILLSGSAELILDGSNSGWYTAQLERFKADNFLSFDEYNTYELGAYLKRW